MHTRLGSCMIFCLAISFAYAPLHAQRASDAQSKIAAGELSLDEHKKALEEIVRKGEGDAQIEAAEILARIDDSLKIPLLEGARKVFNTRHDALSLKVERSPKVLRIVVDNDDLDLIKNVVLQSLREDQSVAKEIDFPFDSESPLEEISLSSQKSVRILARDQNNNVLLVYDLKAPAKANTTVR